jgi:hypothetical protein
MPSHVLQLPKTYPKSRYAPTIAELEFMYNWIKNNINTRINVLEFGSGISTWTILTALESNLNEYIAVEDIQFIKEPSKHCSKVKFITTSWYQIPEDKKYDLVFVDSSAGYPPGTPGLHRVDALQYSEKLMSDKAVVIIHDWHGRSGKEIRRHLENNNYVVQAVIEDKTGLGIYRRK